MELAALIMSAIAVLISVGALVYSRRQTLAHEANARVNSERLDAEQAASLAAQLKLMAVEAEINRDGLPLWRFDIDNAGPHIASSLRLTLSVAGTSLHSLQEFPVEVGARQSFEVLGPDDWGGELATVTLKWSDGRGEQTKDQSRPLPRHEYPRAY